MPYNRVERKVAALLDAAPGLRAVAKAGYQRFNYLVHGGRRKALRLHPSATVERAVEPGSDGKREKPGEECFFGYFGLQPWSGDGRRFLFHRWRAHEGAGSPSARARSRVGNRAGARRVVGLELPAGHDGPVDTPSTARSARSSMTPPTASSSAESWRRTAPSGGIPGPYRRCTPAGARPFRSTTGGSHESGPEYGYDVEVGNFSPDQPPERDGLWRIDLDSGTARLVVSLAELSRCSRARTWAAPSTRSIMPSIRRRARASSSCTAGSDRTASSRDFTCGFRRFRTAPAP